MLDKPERKHCLAMTEYDDLLTLSGDLSLALQIALVSNDDHGEVVLVLDSQDLLLESGDFLEALS